MAFGLPKMKNSTRIERLYQDKFSGLNHTLACGDGEIYDMENLSARHFPVLSTRTKRKLLAELANGNGLYSRDGLLWVDGTEVYYRGAKIDGMSVTSGEKTICALGAFVVILPDKKYYNTVTGEYGAVEALTAMSSLSFKNGTIYGTEAKCNTVYNASANFNSYFKAGDAVTISGCTTHPENNKTPIIREISEDGHSLRFYEYTFVLNGAEGETDYTESGSLRIERTMPDMDFLIENENRLWGCKGDTIYASKLGDIFNWNVFDGVATDSFAVDVGSDEDFTGAVSFLGYPVFFKPSHIYKVYGSIPSNYQIMGSATLGVKEDSSKSLAIAGEVLFYNSRSGMMAYSGGLPRSIQEPLGVDVYKNAVAGSDGLRYFVSVEDANGDASLFCFDAVHSTWHREDDTRVKAFAQWDNLYMLTDEGEIWTCGELRTDFTGTEERDFDFCVEFGDYVDDSPNTKTTAKILLRLELDEDSEATVSIYYDSIGAWTEVTTLETDVKRSYYLPVIPHRFDHYRIKIEGTGGMRVYSIGREIYKGSANRSR